MKTTKLQLIQLLAKSWLTKLKLANAAYFKSHWYENTNKNEDIILSIANTPHDTHLLAMEANYTILMCN